MDQPPVFTPDTDLDDFIAERMAKEIQWQERAHAAQSVTGPAYLRLMVIAEKSDSGQARIVAHFLASTFNGRVYHFDLHDLSNLDVAISDDILICFDALRWRILDLFELVPDGFKRVESVIENWSIERIRLE